MKKTSIAKLDMAQTCLSVIHAPEHGAILKVASPSWKKGVAELEALVDLIIASSQAVDGAKETGAAGKAEAKKALSECAWTVVTTLHAQAVDHHRHDLAAATDLGRKEVSEGPARALINRCVDIHRLATENLALLQENNVTEADLAALQKCIDTMEAAHTVPRKNQATRKAARQELNALFDRLTALFNERLDRWAVKFKQTAPEFYHAYVAARVIVDPATARSKESKVEAVSKAP